MFRIIYVTIVFSISSSFTDQFFKFWCVFANSFASHKYFYQLFFTSGSKCSLPRDELNFHC
jgi:hypothetical protein